MNILKTLRSFRFAFKGLWQVGRFENNARVHLLATIIVIGAAFFLKVEKSEWLWLLASIALVWICETFNTAIEKLVDLVSPEYNETAGKVKDLSAGAVLIAASFSIVVALIIFLPKLIQF